MIIPFFINFSFFLVNFLLSFVFLSKDRQFPGCSKDKQFLQHTFPPFSPLGFLLFLFCLFFWTWQAECSPKNRPHSPLTSGFEIFAIFLTNKYFLFLQSISINLECRCPETQFRSLLSIV
jgi:hypothetical protein